jgi:heptosyltransferase-3
LIRPGGIGDCLLCFPAMQDLCASAGYTEVWVPGPVVPLVQFADRVRSIADTGIDTLGIPCRAPSASLVQQLRGFDSIISWYGASREEFGEAVRSLGLNVEFRTALPATDCPKHAVDFFLRSAEPTSRYPFVKVPPSTTGKPFIAVHPFSGSTHKNWPLGKFRELEQRLPLPVRYCKSPEQTLAGDAVQYASLYDLAAWIRGASLYIGNDSGITHLAAACGVPTVVLFGHYSSSAIWSPRGPHVRVVKANSITDLEVDAVLHAVHDLLDAGRATERVDTDGSGPEPLRLGDRA